MKRLKKYVKRNENSLTTSPTNGTDAKLTPSVTNSNPVNCNSDARPTASVTTSTDTENVLSKKKLRFEDDLTTSVKTMSENSVTPNNKPMDDDLQFVDDILDTTAEMEDVESVQSLESDDEFSMEVWSESKA